MNRQGRGRPRSARRGEFTSWVSAHGQFTMGDVVRSLNLTLDQANKAIVRATSAGELQRVGTKRTESAKRPVAVYEATAAKAAQVPDFGALTMAWAR